MSETSLKSVPATEQHPLIVSPNLYAAMKRDGYDMTHVRKTELIPSVRSRFPETFRPREKSKYEPTRDRGSAHFDNQPSNPTRKHQGALK